MSKLQKKVATALATGALLLNSALPIFADVTLEISGNGSDTVNTANVDVDQSTTVVQENTANITNNVDASANTGKNDANRNTGGSVSVDTGNASVGVGVSNAANSNVAEVNCCEGDVDVLISGNGDSSRNTADVDVNQSPGSGTAVFQTNKAKINNDVSANADTGRNDANRNTGGSVSIDTGRADVLVGISNQANANYARVGGNGGGASLSARILGNGSDSTNLIYLDYDRAMMLSQGNYASIRNHVHANADTGRNDANRNTGGTVSIDTGNASTEVGIDNMINFNWADVDCGCLLDVLAKIAGNGDSSESTIRADIDDTLDVFQENSCGKKWSFWPRHWWWWKHHRKPCLDNDVTADADTGKNDVERNTGDPGVDPSIETGNADTEVVIENVGNSNVFGDGAPDFELPDFLGGGFSINISLDLSALLALLGLA